MLDRILAATSRLSARRPWWVILVAAVLVLGAGAVGGAVPDRLGTGGFDDPASESARGEEILATQLGAGSPDVVLVVTPVDPAATVDDPAVAAAGLELTARLAADAELTDVASYWVASDAPGLRSEDGRHALVVARGTAAEVVDTGEHVLAEHAGQVTDAAGTPVLDVLVGGPAGTFAELQTQIEQDLARAESIAIPVTIALLVLVFGSLVAAGLPLLLGIMSILGALGALFAITAVTDVSVFSLNLTIALGLGLGIDYALFMVSRYREELERTPDVVAAVARTVRTAGRTVVFSGLTVAVALCALLFFPLYFLRSFAYAGVAVVVLSVLGAVVVLPAVLVKLGHRVNAGRLLRRAPRPSAEGAWSRVASGVMRRPWPVAIAVTTLLLVLGAPFLGAEWGQPDDRSLPTSAQSRQAGDLMREEFAGDEAATLTIALPGTAADALGAYVAEIGRVANVVAVTPMAADAGSYLVVLPSVSPYTAEGDTLVQELRDVPAPGERYVVGAAAGGLDAKLAIGERLPWAIGFIALTTGLLLFLFTGSVVLPVKALVLNLLSLSATFGAMVWIFQDGRFADVLDFTPTGHLELGVAILMFCVAFGLSMDYEVFLLSRIKEEHDAHGDNTLAVARGLQRTGSIISAAAGLLAIVFVAFAFSGVATVKLLGLGIALAVVMDATLVRGLLVPAVMRLAGDWNWWAPAPLRRAYERFGLRETSADDGAPGVGAATDATVPGTEPGRTPVTVQ